MLGTPLYSADIARWFEGRGWQVEVVTAQPFYPEFRRYVGYGRSRRHDTLDQRIRILRLPTIVPRRGNPVLRVIGDANFALQGVLAALRGQVLRSDYVLSVSPGSPYAVVVGKCFRTRAGRHIAIVHDVQSVLATGLGIRWARAAAKTMQWLESSSLSQADHIFTLSENMKESLEGIGVAKPIRVLPLWRTIQPPESLAGYTAEVQFSGNLGRKQGLDDLVAVIRRLGSVRPGTRVLIRGSGPLRGFVRAALASEPMVRFEDPVPSRRLPEALAETPVHLVAQPPEVANSSVPSKVINAISVGGIVVALAPARSPITLLAKECTAVRVVPPGDIETAARVISEILDSGDLSTLRQSAQRYATEHHDRDFLLGRLEFALIADDAERADT